DAAEAGLDEQRAGTDDPEPARRGGLLRNGHRRAPGNHFVFVHEHACHLRWRDSRHRPQFCGTCARPWCRLRYRGSPNASESASAIGSLSTPLLPPPLRSCTVSTRAGMPTATAFAGTSLVTTAFAPIFASLPMLTPPRIFAPAPTFTRSPSRGASS